MSFVTLAIKKATGQIIFIDEKGNSSARAPEGVKVI